MKGTIFFSGKYGSTEQYALWIGEATGLPVFENKMVGSFWLGLWISKQKLVKMIQLWKRAQQQIPSHLKSEIRKIYPLQEVKEAIRDYTSQMTRGKILLSMS